MFNQQHLKAIDKILPIQISDIKNDCIIFQTYNDDIDSKFKEFMTSKIRQIKLDIIASDEYQNHGNIPEQTLFEKDCEIYDSLNLDAKLCSTIKKDFKILQCKIEKPLGVYLDSVKSIEIVSNKILNMIDEIISNDISQYIKINAEFLQFINCDYTSVNSKYEQFRIIRDIERTNPKFVLIPLSLKYQFQDFIESINNYDIYYTKYIDKIVVGYIKPLVTINVHEVTMTTYTTQYLIQIGVLYEDIMPFRCFYAI